MTSPIRITTITLAFGGPKDRQERFTVTITENLDTKSKSVVINRLPIKWDFGTWSAHIAEFLTELLIDRGPLKTRQVYVAYFRRKDLHDPEIAVFSDVKDLGRELGFLNGRTWSLPEDHPWRNRLDARTANQRSVGS